MIIRVKFLVLTWSFYSIECKIKIVQFPTKDSIICVFIHDRNRILLQLAMHQYKTIYFSMIIRLFFPNKINSQVYSYFLNYNNYHYLQSLFGTITEGIMSLHTRNWITDTNFFFFLLIGAFLCTFANWILTP